jgi:hypothetical protein
MIMKLEIDRYLLTKFGSRATVFGQPGLLQAIINQTQLDGALTTLGSDGKRKKKGCQNFFGPTIVIFGDCYTV